MVNLNIIDELRHQIEALNRDYPELAEDEVLRADVFDGETDLYSALTALVNAEAQAEELVVTLTARLRNLSQRRARLEHRSEYLRDLMLKLMQSANLRKIELPDATLSQRNGLPQIVGEIDVDALPDDLVRIKREPDRTKIRQDLIDHRAIPGLSLSNGSPTLMVKVK